MAGEQKARVGRHTLVVGAGVAGLAAAGALAPFYEHVSLIERDVLPPDATERNGAPQGRHLHVLLAGGARALATLFPNYPAELARAGAVTIRVGRDERFEHATLGTSPRWDAGFDVFGMSRALAEHVLRQQVLALGNVEWIHASATAPRTDAAGQRVVGVDIKHPMGRVEARTAELVIDASGRGELTHAALRSGGYPPPPATRIGIDLHYATGLFAVASGDERLCVMTRSAAHGGFLLPIEGDRVIVTLGSMTDPTPPEDWKAFMARVDGLHTPTLREALVNARPLGVVRRYFFRESRWFHFERMPAFMPGLLPIGDAICRFNPVYAQGMTVAAQQAVALRDVLSVGGPDDPHALAADYFARSAEIIDTPWTLSALPDLLHPGTRGERPPHFARSLRVAAALARLAKEDVSWFRLQAELRHLLAAHGILSRPDLRERLLDVTRRHT